MKRTIWKFPLYLEAAPTEVQMPVGAEVATFDFQDGIPCVWVIVDPVAEKEMRRFKIFGTGHPLPAVEKCCYVGTQQQGPLVWHLFELL